MTYHIAVFNHSPQLLRLFQAALTTRGYTVSTHEETDEGLRQAVSLRPDLIILGNNRSFDRDDISFFRLIRAHESTASTPVLFASTVHSSGELVQPLKAESGVYFVPKPFNYKMLVECVERALNGRAP